MKTIKRSLNYRFYNRGYRAGIDGKSRELCPAIAVQVAMRLSGWRDGRAASWDGLTGVSGIHCDRKSLRNDVMCHVLTRDVVEALFSHRVIRIASRTKTGPR